MKMTVTLIALLSITAVVSQPAKAMMGEEKEEQEKTTSNPAQPRQGNVDPMVLNEGKDPIILFFALNPNIHLPS